MEAPSWAVVATVDEPAVLIAAFVRHHLALGAGEVHVFLDSPNPEAEALLAGQPRCVVTRCDDAYWAASHRKTRPPRHTARQKHNADRAYAVTSCDWLLHCDADEFLRDGDALVAALLGAGGLGYLRVPNVERVHLPGDAGAHIFEGGFRGPQPEALLPQIYGRFARFMNKGVSGHLAGKGIVRTGRPYLMGVHFPRLQDERRDVPYGDAAAELLHFDGMTPLHFTLKLLRRAYETVSGPPRPHGEFRKAQFAFMKTHAGRPREVQRLTEGVQSLTMEQVTLLRGLGALSEHRFFPQGCGALDLSAVGFDAELRRREADLIATAGLQIHN